MTLPTCATRISPLTPIALACFAAVSHGQTTGSPLETSILETTVVTATRTETPILEVPYTAHVIDREDFLERRNVRTFPDALRDIPGITIQRTAYGQASPFIRGFTGFRTLALIDGIRLNNA